jgi:hypothetical protein
MDDLLRELIEEKITNSLSCATDGKIQEIANILDIAIPEGVM